jgi:SAM-dependent methyltransferase
LSELAPCGAYRVGVENDDAARAVASVNCDEIHAGTAEHLPAALDGRQFDVVIMKHVLEHCLDPRQAVENVRRLVKPGGAFICETPNNHAAGLRQRAVAWSWLDVPRHLNFFTAQSLTSLCEQAGFRVDQTQFRGYVRQFQPPWVENEQHIWDTFRATGTPTGQLPRRNGSWPSWKLFLRTMFAAPARKYDSVSVIARPVPEA